ncbi:MAG: LacI family DNA-binding transcriptional regulator [Ilumatobacter sp.]|uniref:LacI family DNA-binding transcriptional regulator n=1 Tax=Ilumatobacter sp. TaxID=1967498 RepID=UPI002604D0AF|nr:LacI family DNA-binding transcriptional regulator [Ilumatobacter sp.]MDJ0771242.1 LacI family DNA-binding transcriptional regulator [Ilumatobacter sp.]
MSDAQRDPTPRPRRSRATIEDVARVAGVSVATVSRALRDLPNVANSTRERVQRVADELSYRADPAASRLATGRSRSVAVAVPQLNGWYFSNVVAGVEAVAAESGYDTVVVGMGAIGKRRGLLEASESIHRRVDGLIVVDITLTPEELDSLHRKELPVVLVGPETSNVPSVGIDDVAVGRLAAEHLIELGHRRIGLVHGPLHDPFEFRVPHQRQQGFEDVCRDAGIDPDPRIHVPGNFTIQGGYDALEALLGAEHPPTAVFALADEMAFGLLHAARDRLVDIPGQLSVIGVDDHDVAAVVGLTTVRQDVAEHGARAARVLIDQLNGEEPDLSREHAPVTLIQRSTTGPPPS